MRLTSESSVRHSRGNLGEGSALDLIELCEVRVGATDEVDQGWIRRRLNARSIADDQLHLGASALDGDRDGDGDGDELMIRGRIKFVV